MRMITIGVVVSALLVASGYAGARHAFSTHMLVHLSMVLVAAPVIALALPARIATQPVAGRLLSSPLLASLAELIVVWGWHTPAMHRAAGASPWWFGIEQVSFLAVGTWLWAACIGGAARSRAGALAGVGALLLTSMHMTLLGALLTMSPRPLYPDHHALADQQLGGLYMLVAGGLAYLGGGLFLLQRLLRTPPPAGGRPAASRR